MTTIALARVALVHPLGDMGDRLIQGISTLLQSDEWHIEADYHRGSIGDVTVYRNKSVYIKGAAPNWEWYAAIPTANIKAYRLSGALPVPSTLAKTDEPQATTQAAKPASAGAGGHA